MVEDISLNTNTLLMYNSRHETIDAGILRECSVGERGLGRGSLSIQNDYEVQSNII